MTDSKPKFEQIKADNEPSFLSELDITGINFQVLLRSNRENEDLDYLAQLGLKIINELQKIEDGKRKHDVL